jgi:hypothetical protein
MPGLLCVRPWLPLCRFLQEVVGNMVQQAHGRIVRMLQQAELFKDVGGLAWVPKVRAWENSSRGGKGCTYSGTACTGHCWVLGCSLFSVQQAMLLAGSYG